MRIKKKEEKNKPHVSLTIRPITSIYKIHFNCIDENFIQNLFVFHKQFVLMHNTTVLTAATLSLRFQRISCNYFGKWTLYNSCTFNINVFTFQKCR